MRGPPAVSLSLLSSALLFASFCSAGCSPLQDVKLTFYGWPDNSPPGPDNAFDCGRGKGPDGSPIAGGTGTYDDPISFATSTSNTGTFPQCGIVYVPTLKKYFRNEDDCAQCDDDFHNGGQLHIDLWTGSNQKGGDNQVGCENSLPGGSTTIISDPPKGLDVDTTPLYDPDSGTCNQKSFADTTDGLCSGSSPGINRVVTVPKKPTLSSKTPTTLKTSIVSTPGAGGRGPSSLATGCTWQGHCIGDPCATYDDCDGTDVCGPEGTCVALDS